jgi:hypothetical protein
MHHCPLPLLGPSKAPKGCLPFLSPSPFHFHVFAQISAEERAFLDNEVEKLCEISNEYDFYKKKDLSKYLFTSQP